MCAKQIPSVIGVVCCNTIFVDIAFAAAEFAGKSIGIFAAVPFIYVVVGIASDECVV